MIKYIVMDVDGTLTDGKIYMSDKGELMKAFNIKDGYGIRNIALPNGIIPVIITGRESEIVTNRAKELGVALVYQGVSDKAEKLKDVTDNLSEVAFIGDDLNDMPCIDLVKNAGGVVGCPSDAVSEVRAKADLIAEHKGGEGAVRDFIDWLIG